MESTEVARELGRLTEAVNGLKGSVEKHIKDTSDLEVRVGKLENKLAWAKGIVTALGGAVGLLGIERLSLIFRG